MGVDFVAVWTHVIPSFTLLIGSENFIDTFNLKSYIEIRS